MGVYMLDVKELEEKLDDFLRSLEGDFAIGTFCNAFNNIAIKEEWRELIFSKKVKIKKRAVSTGKSK